MAMKNKGNTYQTNRPSGARVMEGGKQNKQTKKRPPREKAVSSGTSKKGKETFGEVVDNRDLAGDGSLVPEGTVRFSEVGELCC